jgi:hypothetical protein
VQGARKERPDFAVDIGNSLLKVALPEAMEYDATDLVVCQSVLDIVDKIVADVAWRTLSNDYMGA